MLKQMEEQKKAEEARKIEEERLQEQYRKEEERDIQEAIDFDRRDRRETIQKNLPDEPAAGTPDTAQIAFRAVATGKRITRRFLKTDSMKLLYDYVRTIP